MAHGGSTNLSDLVKEMVKEMDANEFYARGDIYDESSEEPWYSIEISLEGERGGGSGSAAHPPPRALLRKPWSEFQRLHYLLFTDEFGCDEAIKDQLPSLPTGPTAYPNISSGNGEDDGEPELGKKIARNDVAGDLTIYLNALLAIPAVVQSQVFSGFLGDRRRRSAPSRADGDDSCAEWGDGRDGRGGEGPQEPETAIDFLLQPFDYTSVYVPRRGSHSEQIDVLRGESVVWKFEVLDHLDINFSVVFRPHPVVVPSHRPDSGDDLAVDGGAADYQVTSSVGRPVSPGPKGTKSADSPAASPDTVNAEVDGGTNSRRRRKSGWWGMVSVSQRASGKNDMIVDRNGATEGLRYNHSGDDETSSQEKTVHLPTRYSTGGGDPVQGSFTCPADGTCILRWDNSYSRLRGKRLCFVMESATVQTMRAAIEAAGAIGQKRRATRTRSAAAQTILDGGFGHASATVTAVGIGGDGLGGFDDCGQREVDTAANPDGTGGVSNESCDSNGYYRFGRVRRVAAALLRDLGMMVDAREKTTDCSGSYLHGTFIDDDSGTTDAERSGSLMSPGGGGEGLGGSGCAGGNVDVEGVNKLVEKFELLEDEVASASARRAQSEAQSKVLLATLQKTNTRADRLERTLEETQEQLTDVRLVLEDTEASRNAEAGAAAAATVRLQASEEQLLRTKRERDLLQAERSVWQVARSGIQEELAKVVAELELERHRHEDASQALAKSHESRAHAEAEAARLSRRLEEERGGVGGIRAALAAERESARLAREEAEDARAAVAELDATVSELGAQKRVLVAGLRARERALGDRCAAAEARAEESGMMRRAAEARVKELEEDAEGRDGALADAEVRLQRLRAEKKVLLAEVRRGVGSGGSRVSGSGDGGAGGAGDDASSIGSGGGKDKGAEEGDGVMEAMPPPPSVDAAQDNKATLKQLSRQLVHLRERQHHLREDLRSDPSSASTQRLSNDVDRAVQNLETRVRRLLAVVAGGVGEATEGSSVASSPGPTSPESPAIGAGKGGAKTVGVEGSISRQERKSLEGSAAPHPPAQQSMESDTETYSV